MSSIDLFCDIHNNFPIYHIDLKNDSNKNLLCIKCISDQQMEMDFLLLPDIINCEEKLFLENWPPLSDEMLRNKIISLYTETNDVNQQIFDFYDKFTVEVNQILAEKKKEQLIQAQKMYEFKDKIIDQYCQMASVDKIKECFVQKNQKLKKIEKSLKNQIDSQHSAKDEYTSILSHMMQQYELISQLNIQKPTKIKQNILQILKIINLIPQNNFYFENTINLFSKNDIKNYQQKIKEESLIQQNNNQKIDYLMKQLDFCQDQLIQFINSNDWQIEDFLLNQQTFTVQNQMNPAQLLKDQHLNIFIKPKQIQNNDNNLSINFKFEAKLQVQKINNELDNSWFYIDYLLKPEKKYLVRINFEKSNLHSDFFAGIVSNFDRQQQLQSQGVGWNLTAFQNNLAQRVYIGSRDKLVQTFEFRICIKQQIFKLADFPNYCLIEIKDKFYIKSEAQYYFAIQFLSNYLRDKLEIDFQELDEIPNYW
ncbi:hypothetical protein ABPG74_006602 [Tetrahymena malaccensis]